MANRFNGLNRYPHTQADEDFNNLMVERDLKEEAPREVARIALSTELTSPLRIDAPMAGAQIPEVPASEQLSTAS